MHANPSPTANGPSGIGSCVRPNGRPAVAPASLGRVTKGQFLPAFPRGLALSPPPATRGHGFEGIYYQSKTDLNSVNSPIDEKAC